MSNGIPPRIGSSYIFKAGNAAMTSSTQRTSQGECALTRVAGPKARLFSVASNEFMTQESIFIMRINFYKYNNINNFIGLMYSKFTMYKNKKYNFSHKLIFIFDRKFTSVTKLTCNFITDNAHFLRYILGSRRRS